MSSVWKNEGFPIQFWFMFAWSRKKNLVQARVLHGNDGNHNTPVGGSFA